MEIKDGTENAQCNFNITCPICYYGFDNKKKIITLKCGHFFCDLCFEKLYDEINCQEFKCSLCRSISDSYSLSNDQIITKYNSYLNKSQICHLKSNNLINSHTKNNDNEILDNFLEKEKIFCKSCMKLGNKFENNFIIIDNDKHDDSHEMLSLSDIFILIDDYTITENDDDSTSKFSKCYNLGNKVFNIVYSKIIQIINDKNDLNESQPFTNKKVEYYLTYFFKNMYQSISRLPEKSESDKYNKLKLIHSFKKRLKLLRNHRIIENITKNMINFYNIMKDEKKSVPCVYENTKKIALFDFSFLELSTFEIADLNFNFNKSQSIEYDHTTQRFFFISEDIKNTKACSKIWEYSKNNNTLKSILNLDNYLFDHRTIIIRDNLFIIGGRYPKNPIPHGKKKNGMADDNYIYSNEIHLIDKYNYAFSKSYFKLSYPRACFGLAFSKNKIYLCFGVTNEGEFLNNIEIVNISYYSPLKFTSFIQSFEKVNLTSEIKLKNSGVLIKQHNRMIILGGEKENFQPNSSIYCLDISDKFKVLEIFQSKEIVSGSFSNYGIECNSINGIISNFTIISEMPHVYLYSDMRKKWSCHAIDIY